MKPEHLWRVITRLKTLKLTGENSTILYQKYFSTQAACDTYVKWVERDPENKTLLSVKHFVETTE